MKQLSRSSEMKRRISCMDPMRLISSWFWEAPSQFKRKWAKPSNEGAFLKQLVRSLNIFLEERGWKLIIFIILEDSSTRFTLTPTNRTFGNIFKILYEICPSDKSGLLIPNSPHRAFNLSSIWTSNWWKGGVEQDFTILPIIPIAPAKMVANRSAIAGIIRIAIWVVFQMQLLSFSIVVSWCHWSPHQQRGLRSWTPNPGFSIFCIEVGWIVVAIGISLFG